MTDSAETVHVVFGLSIAATLRVVLRRLGRAERVVGLVESLSVGPIDPPDPALRLAWDRSVLGATSMLPGELDGDPLAVDEAWAKGATLLLTSHLARATALDPTRQTACDGVRPSGYAGMATGGRRTHESA